MLDNIAIIRAGKPVGLKVFDFPGGEVGVKIDIGALGTLASAPSQTIVARMQNSRDFMALALVTDALRRIDRTPIELFMPYVPYARQDRIMVPGESFSLKVFANLINALEFDSVTVLDPHSDVTGALFERLKVITQLQIINGWRELTNRLMDVTLVSPDAGANKKTAAIAGYLGHRDFIRADKKRDLATGKIIETIVYADDLSGQTIAIIDDILDGGKTFRELAKALKAKGAAKVILYTTHGIFSNGVSVLLEDGIDELWVTNSFKTDIDPRVKVLDINTLT